MWLRLKTLRERYYPGLPWCTPFNYVDPEKQSLFPSNGQREMWQKANGTRWHNIADFEGGRRDQYEEKCRWPRETSISTPKYCHLVLVQGTNATVTVFTKRQHARLLFQALCRMLVFKCWVISAKFSRQDLNSWFKLSL